ncbi:Solvent efflux pump periplasmic linker SrpA [Polaromonas vacuolata]|uniref:Solvent efflux pump periplasmic linker SrpA n=2 Tax=Polaromonas vacuolata TaxID=37448 RepID=A0A6H2HA34_9BURK|nr:Solvent efflux pump periplasmic linker SrpA [Polaromonas vacuolata]
MLQPQRHLLNTPFLCIFSPAQRSIYSSYLVTGSIDFKKMSHAWPHAKSTLLTMLCLSTLLTACSGKSEAPAVKPPTEVGVVTMQPERQIVTNELPGRTSAFLTAEIRPQVGGIIEQRPFTEGAQVKTGQLLYQLDNASYLAAQANAQALLTRSEAALSAAKRNANRNAELVKINAISQQLADDSQALMLLATSDLAVAKAALDSARINLAYTRIVAPINGRITTSSVTPGALVTANQSARHSLQCCNSIRCMSISPSPAPNYCN